MRANRGSPATVLMVAPVALIAAAVASAMPRASTSGAAPDAIAAGARLHIQVTAPDTDRHDGSWLRIPDTGAFRGTLTGGLRARTVPRPQLADIPEPAAPMRGPQTAAIDTRAAAAPAAALPTAAPAPPAPASAPPVLPSQPPRPVRPATAALRARPAAHPATATIGIVGLAGALAATLGVLLLLRRRASR